MNNICTELSLEQVCSFLQNHDDYLILTHASPDGDTIGSGYALMHILKGITKNARVILSEPLPQKYSYLSTDMPEFEPKTVIAVDVADLKLLSGECAKPQKIDLCIDHHISNKRYADNLFLQDFGACCECIYLIAKKLDATVTKQIADALYTGITTDTGCFRYSNATAETHRAAAELMELGADAANINRLMFETNSKAKIELEKRALGTIEYHFGGKCAVMTIDNEMITETACEDSDLDGISALPRTIEGVLIGVTMREKEKGVFKISIRTFEPVSACEIAAELGGGGHVRAAGCRFTGTETDAKNAVLKAVEKVVGVQ